MLTIRVEAGGFGVLAGHLIIKQRFFRRTVLRINFLARNTQALLIIHFLVGGNATHSSTAGRIRKHIRAVIHDALINGANVLILRAIIIGCDASGISILINLIIVKMPPVSALSTESQFAWEANEVGEGRITCGCRKRLHLACRLEVRQVAHR